MNRAILGDTEKQTIKEQPKGKSGSEMLLQMDKERRELVGRKLKKRKEEEAYLKL